MNWCTIQWDSVVFSFLIAIVTNEYKYGEFTSAASCLISTGSVGVNMRLTMPIINWVEFFWISHPWRSGFYEEEKKTNNFNVLLTQTKSQNKMKWDLLHQWTVFCLFFFLPEVMTKKWIYLTIDFSKLFSQRKFVQLLTSKFQGR